VQELAKPDFTTCAHVCEAGCGIYLTRPADCRDFSCLWLAGYLPLEDCRPSELGIMFDCDGDDETGWVLDVYEAQPNAFAQRARLDELIAYISERMKVLRVDYYPYRRPLLMVS
jgi:hypothetical protein